MGYGIWDLGFGMWDLEFGIWNLEWGADNPFSACWGNPKQLDSTGEVSPTLTNSCTYYLNSRYEKSKKKIRFLFLKINKYFSSPQALGAFVDVPNKFKIDA
jgi:hypothetical protein